MWELVLCADQFPASERVAFLQSARIDPFLIRQGDGDSSKGARVSRLPAIPESELPGRYPMPPAGRSGPEQLVEAFYPKLKRLATS
jgi:hypothetical protein